MMTPTHLFLFVLVIAGLSTVHSQRRRKANPCERSPRRKGWGGQCFALQSGLYPTSSCDSIIYNQTISGCSNATIILEDPPINIVDPPNEPIIEFEYPQACCINCDRFTRHCERRWTDSWGSNVRTCHNCPHGLIIGYLPRTRPGSDCFCCKECKMKRKCHGGVSDHGEKSRCITDDDPKYNRDWCTKENNGVVEERWCKGWGCHCCKFPEEG